MAGVENEACLVLLNDNELLNSIHDVVETVWLCNLNDIMG